MVCEKLGAKCAWVTAVVDRVTALEAIILAKSLKRVITFADLVVLVDSDIHSNIRQLLAEVYDVVLPLNLKSAEAQGIGKLDLAMLYAWNLGMYNTCALLLSNHLILKNVDSIFGRPELCTLTQKSCLGNAQPSVFVLEPCPKTQDDLTTLCVSRKLNLSNAINLHFNISGDGGEVAANSEKIETSVATAKTIAYLWNTVEWIQNWKSAKNNPEASHENQKIFQLWSLIYGEMLLEKPFNLLVENGTKLTVDNDSKWLTAVKGKPFDHFKDSIAIVGHSCRFPGANNISEFWELLKSGGDAISKVPPERLMEHQLHDPKYTESMAGFLKCPIDEFDAKFFGISPREAKFIDPKQRLLSEVAWEALENAAIDPHSLRGTNTGVFTGVWTNDYERLVSISATANDFHHVILGNAFSATSARVSYLLGLNGPNVAVESGCSSSMVSLHLACDSLRKRETDLALVLGANIIILQFPLSEVLILAKDGHCKTFDAAADGFGRAEGVAVVVLKRMSEAVDNGDNILGIIRGTGISNEGTTSSFGTPSKYCQEIAVREALRSAGVKPEQVDYVEAHGTGTPIGDPVEFAAISSAYKSNGGQKRERPLVIGSVKTNVGHTEATAGLAGLIKVLLSMKNETIPKHLNVTTINPDIDLSVVPAIIPLEEQSWKKRSDRVRIAGVSSFGISGTNVHAIIEEPPQAAETFGKADVERKSHILTLSAKDENSLRQLVNEYIRFFNENPRVNAGDVTFTANTGRAHMKHRVAVIGDTVEELKSELANVTLSHIDPNSKGKKKIAFLFTGQGSQYSGMAKALYQTHKSFRNTFQKISKIAAKHIGVSLQNLLWDDSIFQISNTKLDHSTFSQLGIFAVEYSLLKLWKSVGIEPDFVLGHSVGEFAAAAAAGMISVEDAVGLVAKRGALIEAIPLGGMLAVHSSKEEVQKLIKTFVLTHQNLWVDIAVVNSNEEIVVAGFRESLNLFHELCNNNGISAQLLAASHAFHSRAMDEILKPFGLAAETFVYHHPKINYVSCTTGALLENAVDSSYWQIHAREPVNFPKGMKTLAKHGCEVFIEIGAHPILLALGMSNVSVENSLWLPSIRRIEDNWRTFLNSVGKLYTNGIVDNIKWQSLDSLYSRNKLVLPNYQFQRQHYWIDNDLGDFNPSLHPLLGKRVTVAGIGDHDVFESLIKTRDLPYLQEHQVANVVILPGAGFLEMILAGTANSLHKNQSALNQNVQITVEDFLIECPLELSEEKAKKVQVVISNSAEGEKMKGTVFVHQNLNGYNDEKGWKQYASASIAISHTLNTKDRLKSDLESFGAIQKRCQLEDSIEKFYNIAGDVGINFGESFRSIVAVWKGDCEGLAKISLSEKAGKPRDYICHPVVLDAMIQIFGLSIASQSTDLYLPIAIEKFTIVKQSLDFQSFFAHATWEDKKMKGLVKLYDENATLLATMEGVHLVRTSLSSFLNVINDQKNRLPGIYDLAWRLRSNEGTSASKVNMGAVQDSELILEGLRKSMEGQMQYMAYKARQIQLSDQLCTCSILYLWDELGWKPRVGSKYLLSTIMYDLSILDKYTPTLIRKLRILVEEGYLTVTFNSGLDENEWTLLKEFPSRGLLLEEESKIMAEFKSINMEEHTITNINFKLRQYSGDILLGNVSPVTVLFGETEEGLNALHVYTKGVECVSANIRISNYMQLALSGLKGGGSMEGGVVKILEIGAGSGATAKEIIKILQQVGIPFTYTFTDISAAFFDEAKKQFPDTPNVDFKTLNIEDDPLGQGFPPHFYDIVVAAHVIHATESLVTSMANVRRVMAPSGLFILQEILYAERSIDEIFGYFEGYWRFKDFDLRQHHPCVSQHVWDKVFLESGFTRSTLISEIHEIASCLVTRSTESFVPISRPLVSKKNSKEKTWIVIGCQQSDLLEKLKENFKKINRKNIFLGSINPNININDGAMVDSYLDKIYGEYDIEGILYVNILGEDREEGLPYQKVIIVPLLNICQYLAKRSVESRLVFVTKGISMWGDPRTIIPSATPAVGLIKTLATEVEGLNVKLIDLDADFDPEVNLESQQIFYEMFAGEDGFVSYRNGRKYVSRFIPLKDGLGPLELPQGRYTATIPTSKKINDVGFKVVGKYPVGGKNVEVLIKATALNFRDIFVVLKPEEYSTIFTDCIGTDIAGIVTDIGSEVTQFKVGDQVFGCAYKYNGIASHTVVDETAIIAKPKQLTFADASTLPSVFMTAFFCIEKVAKLQKGETILIHVASGGVGLIAIQIAKEIGANVIATAGSHRKRTYLRSLGIEHVFHSRDLTYGENIHRVTGGKGVEVVLNSLTGEGFVETSLKACALGARFMEIGKVNIWKSEQVEKFRPDIRYTIVDLEKERDGLGDIIKHMKDKFSGAGEGTFRPLPYKRFEMVNVREAMNYFCKSQHIGKIVIANPEIREENCRFIKNEMIFNDVGTYLITGGLGGIGLEVAKWMADTGARNIVLVGRTAPNEKTLQVIAGLKGRGCDVTVVNMDIGNMQQTKDLFSKISTEMNPLRGVIHSAGFLSDGMIINQSWEKFESVFNAKVAGSWNLHLLTKDLLLEHFVLFSSAAAVWGPMGQTNHCAANLYMDALAHYRHAMGLPAQSINWGAWAEVGAFTRTSYGLEGKLGIKPFSPRSGINALKHIMTRPYIIQTGVIQIDVEVFKRFTKLTLTFDELEGSNDQSGTDQVQEIDSDAFWRTLSVMSLEERVLHFKTLLAKYIRKTLKLPDVEVIDEYLPFKEMGLDSLMAVEMRNKLQGIVGKRLTLKASSLMDYPTLVTLSRHLAELTMTADLSNLEAAPADVAAQLEELIKADSIFSWRDIQIGKNFRAPSACRTILLTGATGHFGVYLLNDFLKAYAHAHVYCVVRAKTLESAERRIALNLQKFNLPIDVLNSGRVTVILGNIVDENLGLSEEMYKDLSEKVDYIFHLAAKVNHVEPYRVSKLGTDIRSVNVLGTVNILKFAANLRTKRVFYATSAVTANRLTPEGRISESLPDAQNNGDGLAFGYAVSKFVSEKLLRQANEAGIPCTVIRYPSLGSHSVSGLFTVDTNFWLNIVFISFRLRMMPDHKLGWRMLPIDFASKLTLEILFSDRSETGLYNLVQPTAVTKCNLLEMTEGEGIEMEVVDGATFSERLSQKSRTNNYLSYFKEAYFTGDPLSRYAESCPAHKIAMKSGADDVYVASEKLLGLIPDYLERIPNNKQSLQIALEYAKSKGLLKDIETNEEK